MLGFLWRLRFGSLGFLGGRRKNVASGLASERRAVKSGISFLRRFIVGFTRHRFPGFLFRDGNFSSDSKLGFGRGRLGWSSICTEGWPAYMGGVFEHSVRSHSSAKGAFVWWLYNCPCDQKVDDWIPRVNRPQVKWYKSLHSTSSEGLTFGVKKVQ